MAADGTEKRISLKLMVLKNESKVIFAEAGKDFVDVLFSFLTLPLGTIERLVCKESKLQPLEVASLSSLYQSVENLDEQCFTTDTCKGMLLHPRNSMEAYCKSLKINIDDTEPTQYFVCNNVISCSNQPPLLISTFKNKRCRCLYTLGNQISFITCILDGFVKCNTSFMITDDLKVFPNSLDKVVNVLKDSGINNMSSVSEMTVNISMNQVVDLLKRCLCSRTVFTDLFIGKRPGEILYKGKIIAPSDFKPNDSSKIVVKIMQRKSNGKIVFAEGKEDFADFLVSLLTIPLGGAVHLMEGCSCVGSVDRLYKSVVDLDENYFTTKEVKNKFLDPMLAPQFKLSTLLPLMCDDVPKCLGYIKYCGDTKVITGFLTSIGKEIDSYYTEGFLAVEFVDPLSNKSDDGERYINGPTTYMATDDLVLTPSSSISVMSLLSSMSIRVDDLMEKVISIGMEEGLRILQASLISTSALTLGLSHLLTKV